MAETATQLAPDPERRLGELLINNNLISAADLMQVTKNRAANGPRLAELLISGGKVNEDEFLEFLSEQYQQPRIDLDEFQIEPEVSALVPAEFCHQAKMMPLNRSGATLIIAVSDPTNLAALDDLKFITSFHIQTVLASYSSVERALHKYYPLEGETPDVLAELAPEFQIEEADIEDTAVDISDLQSDSPAIKIVNFILIKGIQCGCSDIHIEPFEKFIRVRYRVDGKLREAMRPPVALKNALVTRLKVMCKLDIAERRAPQDGRFAVRLKGNRKIGFRVSVQPVIWGEKIVLRILDQSNLTLDLKSLGFDPLTFKNINDAIAAPYGMFLVTGPTGSGKTTTLYSILSALNDEETNISTAEDPVEYNLVGVNQVQTDDAAGMNFSTVLRSFLRQDPDVILVGEIRDFETAEIAIKAAFTGHLVLSTLHTNDASSTITRLVNMGIEPFNVTAAVILVLAQRLARRVCKKCEVLDEIDRLVLEEIGMRPEMLSTANFRVGEGCDTCSDTGYKGRVAVYEALKVTDALRQEIVRGATAEELKAAGIADGMLSLRQSALLRLSQGITTVEEVLRVSVPDER